MSDLQGKVLVVIGGTTGLGLSASKAFISVGASVVVVGRNAENAHAAAALLGSSALALTADATNPRTAPKAIDAARRRFGRFDGLYHVAGGSGRKAGDGPLHEITEAGWQFTFELNLSSLFFSNRAAAQQFLKQESPGTILNMSSVLGFSPAPAYFGTHAYAAAKAAIIGLTRSCAAYYAPHNIRFNTLAPALVETPMSERALGNETIMKYVTTKQPLDGGRIGHPSDLDAAAIYFLSDDSKFVTGQVLAIDGGWGVTEGQTPIPRRPRTAKAATSARARKR